MLMTENNKNNRNNKLLYSGGYYIKMGGDQNNKNNKNNKVLKKYSKSVTIPFQNK